MVCICFPRGSKENFIVKFLLIIVVTGIVFVSDETRPLLTLVTTDGRRSLYPEAFLTFGSHAKTARPEQSEQHIAVTLFSLAT
jgi:hypothetical protein